MALKFEVKIGDVQVLLDPDQLDRVLAAISECERFEDKYVGGGKGTGGTHYLKQVRPANISELTIRAHPADMVDALRFATKMYDEEQAK